MLEMQVRVQLLRCIIYFIVLIGFIMFNKLIIKMYDFLYQSCYLGVTQVRAIQKIIFPASLLFCLNNKLVTFLISDLSILSVGYVDMSQKQIHDGDARYRASGGCVTATGQGWVNAKKGSMRAVSVGQVRDSVGRVVGTAVGKTASADAPLLSSKHERW